MDFEIFHPDLGLYAEDANAPLQFLLLGSILLFLGNKGIFVAVSFFFSFKNCSLLQVNFINLLFS